MTERLMICLSSTVCVRVVYPGGDVTLAGVAGWNIGVLGTLDVTMELYMGAGDWPCARGV